MLVSLFIFNQTILTDLFCYILDQSDPPGSLTVNHVRNMIMQIFVMVITIINLSL